MKKTPPDKSAILADTFTLKDSTLDVRAHLLPGFKRLAQFPCTDYDFNRRIAENLLTLTRLDKNYIKSMASIEDKYILRNESGGFAVDQFNNYVFKSKDARRKYLDDKSKLDNAPANEKMYFITHEELERTIGKKSVVNGSVTEFTPAMIADLWSVIKNDEDVSRN